MRIRLRLLDAVVEIRTDDDAAAHLLSLLWSQMTTDETGEPDRTYVVARDAASGWVATAGGDVEAIHETLWGVTDALRFQMLELCEARLERFVTLHAAAVARDDRVVLLAGESGAGKTTLTLALLDAGWTYLSDDLAPVEIATGLVHPFPKPLGVKDRERWHDVAHAFAGGPALDPPTGSFLVPPSAWDVGRRPAPPSVLLFPAFTPGGALELEMLSKARAAALASPYLRRLDASTVSLLNRLCTSADSYTVRYGSSAAAAGAIEGLVRTRPRQ